MGENGGEYDEVGEERLEGWTRESSRHEWRVNYTCLISLAPWCPSSLRGRGIQTRSAGSAPGRGFSLYKSLPRPMVTPTDGSHAGSRRDGGSAPTASTLTSSSTTYTGRTPEVTACCFVLTLCICLPLRAYLAHTCVSMCCVCADGSFAAT